MALWLRFDNSRLNKITFEEFLNYLKKHSLVPQPNSNDREQQEENEEELRL